ncbi:MAG: hypothetical protein OXH84_00280 [Gammaproteobacteria bacterium]|nr:hypothetical protein [Gammaproteobacteria bacterium]
MKENFQISVLTINGRITKDTSIFEFNVKSSPGPEESWSMEVSIRSKIENSQQDGKFTCLVSGPAPTMEDAGEILAYLQKLLS